MLVRVHGIEWDTDNEQVDDLPTEVTLDLECLIEDWLTETYGWLVDDYKIEVKD